MKVLSSLRVEVLVKIFLIHLSTESSAAAEVAGTSLVKQFLVLTCLVLCLCQPALHQYISLNSIISLTYSLSLYKIKENVKFVYWFIGLSARSNRINNIMYHVESPVEEP